MSIGIDVKKFVVGDLIGVRGGAVNSKTLSQAAVN